MKTHGGLIAGLLSLSFDGTQPPPVGPTFPPGFGVSHRRIGSVLTDSNGLLIKFVRSGTREQRRYGYRSDLHSRQILAGGSETQFTSVSHAAFASPNATNFGYFVEHTSNNGSEAQLRPTAVLQGGVHVRFSIEGIV